MIFNARSMIVYIWFIGLAALQSCMFISQNNKVKICDSVSGNCIEIEDHKNIRKLFFDKQGYIELDISKIDRGVDGVFICFSDSNIEIVNPNAILLNNNVIDSKISFSNKIRTDSLGIPDIQYFHKLGCFEFNMRARALFPKRDQFVLK